MRLALNATIYLCAAGTAHVAKVADLRLITARDNYSEVTLADGSQLVLRKTLKSWEETLPVTHFHRVHRTLIVNLASIVRYERSHEEHTRLFLDGFDQPVRASRRTWPQLRARLRALHAPV
jgi:DNA-binding LytR/AlgR family response regulator